MNAINLRGVSIALACRTFQTGESCYRCERKLFDENAEIADRLVRLATTHLTRSFGLYFLYLCIVKGFPRITKSFVQEGATVSELSARSDLSPAAYADVAGHWAKMGATIIGGCCEVGPAHIAELVRRLT
ncbi:homocysteine S-methyltransferase family protein [Pseudovibrio exalbescens]|uniref:homocysteine S-methyltransferase family protein n=1 Tax=Pseudovibrio exalbescens TaxID=197461 RepID=UPI00236688F6|nr:homocysteine S-methyltransferase family protein [Pseudovibrio exalbescens]MDD7911507.1 homocysteine S-methyltransferase family protein [Pseudovibrio exalbescens]